MGLHAEPVQTHAVPIGETAAHGQLVSNIRPKDLEMVRYNPILIAVSNQLTNQPTNLLFNLFFSNISNIRPKDHEMVSVVLLYP